MPKRQKKPDNPSHVAHPVEPIEPRENVHTRRQKGMDLELEDLLSSQGIEEPYHLSLGPQNGD